VTETQLLAAEYRSTLVDWGASRESMVSKAEVRRANKLHDKQAELARKLAATDAGRLAILALLDDPDAWVRLTAATRSLEWNAGAAERVLVELRSQNDLPSRLTSNAETVLDLWRDGELRFA
jgi:hypothetical protein